MRDVAPMYAAIMVAVSWPVYRPLCAPDRTESRTRRLPDHPSCTKPVNITQHARRNLL